MAGVEWCGGVVTHVLRRPIRTLLVLILVVALMGTAQILRHFSGSLANRRLVRDTDSVYNYGIVIDAGSSGSRVHLFHWAPHDGTPSKLLNIDSVLNYMGSPLMKKSTPGISSFPMDPERAYNTLIPLLEFAKMHIPEDQHCVTPLYILGTAGMRLLSKEQQIAVMSHIQQRTAEQYPFYLPSDSVEVLSGKMEGVFSWITVNYLLGQFKHDHHINTGSAVDRVSTYGVLDMGGASLQIAFEIPHNVDASQANIVDIDLGCGLPDSLHRHRVYIDTYLGYGANEARNRYISQLVHEHLGSSNSTRRHRVVGDPCLPLHRHENVSTAGGVVTTLIGRGNYTACRNAVLPMVSRNSSKLDDCIEKNCSLKQFLRPSLPYEMLSFYGTSEFWYSMHDVLGIGGQYLSATFDQAAKEFCHTPWKFLRDRYKKYIYPNADYYRLRSQCFKSAWMSAVLHDGLAFPVSYDKLRSASTVNKRSVQWTLGAILYRTRFFPLREIQQAHKRAHTVSIRSDAPHITSVLFDPFFLPAVLVVLVIVLLLFLRKQPTARSGSFISRKRSYSLVALANAQNSLVSRSSTAKLASGSTNSDSYDYPASTVKFFV